jgi:hypothetical protein
MTTRTDPKEILQNLIDLAVEYDRRNDSAMRNYTVSRIRGDEFGMPIHHVEAAMRNSGLTK